MAKTDKAYRVRHQFARDIKTEDGGTRRTLINNSNAELIGELTSTDRNDLIRRGYVEEYDPDTTTSYGTPLTPGLAAPGVAGIDPSREGAPEPKARDKGK